MSLFLLMVPSVTYHPALKPQRLTLNSSINCHIQLTNTVNLLFFSPQPNVILSIGLVLRYEELLYQTYALFKVSLLDTVAENYGIQAVVSYWSSSKDLYILESGGFYMINASVYEAIWFSGEKYWNVEHFAKRNLGDWLVLCCSKCGPQTSVVSTRAC